jgi:Asp-tRNA(Asn)/Glu-tRNA(Gln) amidotransferase A subunit family amidase/creatinine amidohydrolase/Fe(II)-dependent formamide hydrolase-like protein
MANPSPIGLDRRAFMALCSLVGVGHPAFAEALWRRSGGAADEDLPAQPATITKEMVAAATALIGLDFTDAEQNELVETLGATMGLLASVRQVSLPNSVGPAFRFDPELPGKAGDGGPRFRLAEGRLGRKGLTRPTDPAELAFLPVTDLAELIRSRQVTSTELTRLYLDRLQRHGPALQCVVTLTEERALNQAYRADEEIRDRRYRGPLHGIPWGAKDLFAVPGYPTTWGTGPFKDQRFDEPATVVDKLDRAGAVLVAKLTLGELAMGDVWYGGTTKNPWKPDQGSSGSSAGPGSATAAGLVAFSLGTETLGSIVSPSDRNGVTGLRPTFGRVSRQGAMALCWSLDKVGPMTRSVDDCGLVLRAIHGADGRDPSAVDRPFGWTPEKGLAGIRVGFLKAAFDADHPTKPFDDAALSALRSLGVTLIPVELPADLPIPALRIILQAESAAAFDELTRSNRDDQMTRSGKGILAEQLPHLAIHPGGGVSQRQPDSHPGDATDGRGDGAGRRIRRPDVRDQPAPGHQPDRASLAHPAERLPGRWHPGEPLLHRSVVRGDRAVGGRQGLSGGDRLSPQAPGGIQLMATDSVLLEELSWTAVEAKIAAGTRTMVVMTASIEQHGPHLPTMTDTAIGYAVGERVARKLGNALLAPVIRPGCSDHHLAFPGSLSIPEAVFIDTVMATVRSLAPHGFTRFILLSSHGGNFAALAKAAARLQGEFEPQGVEIVALAGREALMETMKVMLAAAAEHGVTQEVDAIHAENTETSVMLARHPSLVDLGRLERGRMGHVDTDELFARGLRSITPNGILGDPAGATAAIGETVVERLAEWIAGRIGAR